MSVTVMALGLGEVGLKGTGGVVMAISVYRLLGLEGEEGTADLGCLVGRVVDSMRCIITKVDGVSIRKGILQGIVGLFPQV